MSDSAAPKWAKWKHIPHAEVWEVIVLSCDFEPEYLRDEIARGRQPVRRYGAPDWNTRVPEKYYDRLAVVVANLGAQIQIAVLDGNDSRCSKISLIEFAVFAESCGWGLPAEFPRKAALDPVGIVAELDSIESLDEPSQFMATDYFDDPYWNMLQVVVWVSTRSREWVSKASDRNRILGRPMTIGFLLVSLIHRGRTALPDIDAAKQEIVSALSKGEIGARGIDDNEQCVKDIPKDDWSHLELFENGNDGICAKYSAYAGQKLKGKLRYSGLKVKRDDALAEWPRSNRNTPLAEAKDSVIKFPAGTEYWPIADLPELISKSLSPGGRENLSDAAKHRAAIVHAWKSNQLKAVSPTNRLPVDHTQGDAEVSIVEILSYVQKFGIFIQLAPPKWDAETVEAITKATHWTDRELEAICFGFPPTTYSDLCMPDQEREELRNAIRQACTSGELIADKTGGGNAIYGGQWRIERLSASRWAIPTYPQLPRWLADKSLREIWAQQYAERKAEGRYSLQEAAESLAKNTTERKLDWEEKLLKAVNEHILPVYRPGSKLRYRPKSVSCFHDEAYWSELNNWLDANEPRIDWRFPGSLQGVQGASVEISQIADKPKQRQQWQEDAILRTISIMGFDPLAIPKAANGKSGIKARVKGNLVSEPGWAGSVFDKAWQRLRSDGRIRDKRD